jgi:hypothetical protein
MKVLACVSLALAVALVPARAQSPMSGSAPARSTTSGFFGSISANGSSISGDGQQNLRPRDSGGGGTLQIGYGFHRNVALFVEATGASVKSKEAGDFLLGHGDLGVRFSLANLARAFVPFLDASITGRLIAQDNVTLFVPGSSSPQRGEVENTGRSFSLGGGLHYFVDRRVAVTTSVRWTGGEFTTLKFGSLTTHNTGFSANTTRVNLGISFYPRG